jgi:hypothetical protein
MNCLNYNSFPNFSLKTFSNKPFQRKSVLQGEVAQWKGFQKELVFSDRETKQKLFDEMKKEENHNSTYFPTLEDILVPNQEESDN